MLLMSLLLLSAVTTEEIYWTDRCFHNSYDILKVMTLLVKDVEV